MLTNGRYRKGTMSVISLEEYLRTLYRPDREFRDGVLMERNVGLKSHSAMQCAVACYIGNRRKKWRITVYLSLRIQLREGWIAIPDIAVYDLPEPDGEIPDRPPLLWIEVLSPEDRMIDFWSKANDVIACGVPNVWMIDPYSLESQLWTPAGVTRITDGTLRLPDSEIVIPLAAALEE